MPYRREDAVLVPKVVNKATFCVKHNVPLKANGECRLCGFTPEKTVVKTISVVPERFVRL